MTKFKVKINGGATQNFVVPTGIYVDAVAAIPAFFEVEYPCIVEIWVKSLLPDYGPYFYGIEYPGGAVSVVIN